VLEVLGIVEASRRERPARLQPRHHGPRGEESCCAVFQYTQRGTFTPSFEILRRLLQLRQDASVSAQGRAGFSACSAIRHHNFKRHPWRTSPPILPGLGFRHTRRSSASFLARHSRRTPVQSIHSPDPISKRLRSAHQGSTCENPGSVEIGRSPLDSRAAAAIAGSGVRMGGTAW
jgi:hypothetical protein